MARRAALTDGALGLCAKKRVVCVLIKDGLVIGVGANDVRRPQEVCPRLPGEGYEKCRTVCDQPAHAEVAAIRDALCRGHAVSGAKAWVHGIRHVCSACQASLAACGVSWELVR